MIKIVISRACNNREILCVKEDSSTYGVRNDGGDNYLYKIRHFEGT